MKKGRWVGEILCQGELCISPPVNSHRARPPADCAEVLIPNNSVFPEVRSLQPGPRLLPFTQAKGSAVDQSVARPETQSQAISYSLTKRPQCGRLALNTTILASILCVFMAPTKVNLRKVVSWRTIRYSSFTFYLGFGHSYL